MSDPQHPTAEQVEAARQFRQDFYCASELCFANGMVDLGRVDEVAAAYALSQTRELEAWKESAMRLLPIQEWGQALGLKLGEGIHSKILPALEELKTLRKGTQAAVEVERRRCAEIARNFYADKTSPVLKGAGKEIAAAIEGGLAETGKEKA